MKPIHKRIIKIMAVVLAGFFVLYLALIGPELWKSYEWQKAVNDYEEAMRKPYKEDVYGGKTPEETWSMFLDALKKGDIDLASKYFAVGKQEEWRNTMKNTKDAGKLNLVIKNLSVGLQKEKDYLQGNKAYYFYELEDSKTGGIYNNSVVFYLNSLTNIWKILVL